MNWLKRKLNALTGYLIPAEHSTMKESPMERELGRISMENETRYNALYRPAFKQYVQGARQLGSPGAIKMAGGLAASGVTGDLTPKLQSAQRGALTSGLSPNSGAFVMNAATNRGTLAKATGNATFGAKMGQRGANLSALQNAVGIGKQQSSAAQQGIADVANMAQQRAENNIQSDMIQSAGLGGAVGEMAGYYGLGPALSRRAGA